MRAKGAGIGVAGLLLLANALTGRGEQIAPGFDFTVYNLTGPTNVVYVVTIERLRSEYKLKVGWPEQRRNFTSRAPTSIIAGLYDDPPGHDVLAATNGSVFGGTGSDIHGTAASDGEILEMPDGIYDTFLFGSSRVPAIRSEITHVNGTLTFADGSSIPLERYNMSPPPIHKVTAYTPQWDSSTRSSFVNPSLAVEVILEEVTYPMRGEKEVSGIVTAIQTGSASQDNPIPAGGMVLTAWGNPKNTIVANTQVGDRLRMRFSTSAEEYNLADMAVTGFGWIIHDGVPNTSNWADRGDADPYGRNPRTVLGWSDTHLFMVVCDGRSAASVGMTFSEMANFLTGTLGALDAINLDGGGSSTMVVDGTVRNVPSDGDGSERYVANAVLLVEEHTTTELPLADPFAAGGRRPGWADKFTYNAVIPFSPAAPGGDGYVIEVADPAGGVETMSQGDFGDADYQVEADIYCEYRPGDAGDGFERYGLFARDSGTGAFGLSSFGGGNCYALTYDSDDGRVRAGKYVNGSLTDFLIADPLYLPSTAWRQFRIDCSGSTIRYCLDGAPIATVTDGTHIGGYAGIGYHELFGSNSNIHGTRADNFQACGEIPGDFDLDGDVDQEDFGHFQACLSGTNTSQDEPTCFDALLDGDGDVDGDDLDLFQGCMSGANIPADPACTGGE